VLESGIDSIPGVVAKKLWTEISCWYKQLEDGDSSSLERAYLEKMHWMNEQVNCSINGKDHPGIVRGVNNYGELLVELEGEVKAYGHQEILVT
jgi:biotin-(acetyl-CoA carboxylase) ligase